MDPLSRDIMSFVHCFSPHAEALEHGRYLLTEYSIKLQPQASAWIS